MSHLGLPFCWLGTLARTWPAVRAVVLWHIALEGGLPTFPAVPDIRGVLQRCKHFEIGGEKKTKGQAY
jgi:hypothetical protein